MNENPEGTPNPLNPNPAPVGPEATPGVAPVTPQPVEQPIVQPAAQPMEQPVAQPVEQPTAQPTTNASIEAALAEGQTVTAQPAEEPAGSVVEPTKKKNGGLIATIAIFLIALVGCAVAAIVIYDPFGFKNGGGSDDRVPKALAALFSEGAPTNVAMDGTVSLFANDEESPVTSLDIEFSSKTNVESGAGTAEATITANFTNGASLEFDADEIHTAKGDLYLKLSGIPEAIENYKNQTVVDCADDVVDCAPTTESTDEYIELLSSLGIIEVIDDEWILIPSTAFSNVDDLVQIDAPAQCLIDAAGTIGEYTDDLMATYNANQFITYSTQDLKITKKQDNLYRLDINADSLASFINAMQNSGFVNELNACMGDTATNSDVDASDLSDIVDALPTIYVEINEKYQFTRVYLKASTEDGALEATADISLSYPSEITVTEPGQYIDINTLLSNVMTIIYSGVLPQE